MAICASRMYIGLFDSLNGTVVSLPPVGAVGGERQHPGVQIQFNNSPAPSSYGTYDLNTGGVTEIAPPGTAPVFV